MRLLGTRAYGVRLPIISAGEDLAQIVADHIHKVHSEEGIRVQPSDIVGVTESIVAKSQGNYATIDQIAADVSAKFPGGEIGLVFPMPSRNRFGNVLKGIAKGANKVYVLFQFPNDEVGNPIVDAEKIEDNNLQLTSAKAFKDIYGEYRHPFTNMDYISFYEDASDNIEVFLSSNPLDILKLTPHALVCEAHNRARTKKLLEKNGAQTVYTLADLMTKPVNGSGYNPEYGVLGSNLSSDDSVKLFPRDCENFVKDLSEKLKERLGFSTELLIYGDGAYKDPANGIWELADPVVSPAYTKRLGGYPAETKLKYIAENLFGGLAPDEKRQAISDYIKKNTEGKFADGTTPRKYSNLVGSLCDLVSGSGDKGTPVILIQGYFDNYASE